MQVQGYSSIWVEGTLFLPAAEPGPMNLDLTVRACERDVGSRSHE